MQLVRNISVEDVEAIKASVFEFIFQSFQGSPYVKESGQIINDLKAREKQGSFIIDQIAIVHSRSTGTREMFVRVIRLAEPLSWKADNDTYHPVAIILVLVCPKDAPKEHYIMMGEISSSLIEESFVETIKMSSEDKIKRMIEHHLLQSYQEKIAQIHKETGR